MIVLGRLSLSLALVFCLASVVFLALGVRTGRKDLLKNGYFAVYGFFLTTVVASAVLLQAFLGKDFSFSLRGGELRRQPFHLLPHRRLLGGPAGLVPAVAAAHRHRGGRSSPCATSTGSSRSPAAP